MTHPSDDLLVRHAGRELDRSGHAALERHLAVCTECRTRLAEFAEMDGVLRRLTPLALPDDFADRVRVRVALADRRPGLVWRQAVAAALVLASGLAAGWVLARASAPEAPTAIVRNAEGPKFALIFAEDPATWAVPGEERQRRYDEFMGWMRGIGDASVRLGGTQLDDTRGHVVGAAARAVGSDLALSGFIVIRAASYSEAVSYAERCPLLARGGQVIVRRLLE